MPLNGPVVPGRGRSMPRHFFGTFGRVVRYRRDPSRGYEDWLGSYVEALAGAACVALKVPEPHDMVPADQRLDVEHVVADLRTHGVDARAEADVEVLVRAVSDGARPGDVVLVMSNGAFGAFVDRLLAALPHPVHDA